MSPRFHNFGGDPPPTEGALLSKIETALDDALDNLGLDSNTSTVKREKYLYLVTEEFSEDSQEPITYSWFKWGVSSLAGPGGSTTNQTLMSNQSRVTDLYQSSPSEIEEFLRAGDHNLPLQQYWEEDFLDFLQRFYSEYAPPEYRELYLSNIRLLKLFDDIEEAIHFGRNPAREGTYQTACEITADLKREVLASEATEEHYDCLVDFTRLFEDVVMMLAKIEAEELEKGHQTAFSELEDFYRDHVWLMIAHSLSINTASGPNVSQVHTWSSTKLEGLRGSFETNLKTQKRMCDAVGLRPDPEDYSSFEEDDEEFDEVVDEFMSVVDGRSSNE